MTQNNLEGLRYTGFQVNGDSSGSLTVSIWVHTGKEWIQLSQELPKEIRFKTSIWTRLKRLFKR